MSTPLWTELADRGVIAVSGADAVPFLHGLLSADIEDLQPGQARLAALLTPQGKILFDGLVLRTENGFLIDCRRDIAADFARRLGFYRLRAKVDVRDASSELLVAACWHTDGDAPPGTFGDPRDKKLGYRAVVENGQLADTVEGWRARKAGLSDYHQHRIMCAVPEGGLDYAYGEAFPHEANMDRLGGVSFTKGCYVGQEVVSRMQHRGTARTRIVPVLLDGEAKPGSEVRAAGRRIGALGSVAQGRGLASLRLDKVRAGSDAEEALTADGVTLTVEMPQWATAGLVVANSTDE